jgi:hypothetical protein
MAHRVASHTASAPQTPGSPSQWKRRTRAPTGAKATAATIIARRMAT